MYASVFSNFFMHLIPPADTQSATRDVQLPFPVTPVEGMQWLARENTRLMTGFTDYLIDSAQRSVLLTDTLRKRGNNFFEHQQSGKPPVLIFDYEILTDGRTLERPCNYSLMRIIPPSGQRVDPERRPYIIIDPRAGHGPGIGGFKEDSQIGVALRAGHPVYFISFSAEPVPQQTLADVAAAEAGFVETVAALHPEAGDKPVIIGNCQAGWAVALLAALHPDLMGPIILNGAPLSYWAGADGKNPMRYAGGLLGGKWLASLGADLGNGRFDGAYLVANMENLNPAHTLWSKLYNLYANIDTEEPRYLEFERWWNGFFLMNADEIEGIVSELFIGNKLETGEIRTPEGKQVNLKNIRSPIVVFASWGDNITPPQQALNWIIDAYGDENEIIRNGQTIVYLLHDAIGHLGIFVSGSVARKEHRELVDTLEMVDDLPPGLFEMVLTPRDDCIRHADLVPGDYTVRIETRTVDDLRALDDIQRDEEYFSSVVEVSEINDWSYKTWLSPWVQMMSSEFSADLIRRLHPSRLQHYWFSDLNPWMIPIPAIASAVRANRVQVSASNDFSQLQQTGSERIVAWLDLYRDLRDSNNRSLFKTLYGPLGLGRVFPARETQSATHMPLDCGDSGYVDSVCDRYEHGGFTEAVIRIVLAGLKQEGGFERRSWAIAQRFRSNPRIETLNPAQARQRAREQWMLLYLDQQKALQSLTALLPTKEERIEAIRMVQDIFMVQPGDAAFEGPVARTVLEILDVDPQQIQKPAA